MNEYQVDYDLHGIIAVRLINPLPGDVAAVSRQLGHPQPRRLEREPDIHLRFVARISTPYLCQVEVRRSAFTDDGFFLLSGGGRAARVRIPFEEIGEPCEIVCEHGLGSVPLLLEIIKLLALDKGVASLHASAFDYRGVGVVVAGWAHGGKTSALLAFTQQGAKFVGDDLILLAKDGQRMFGIPSTIDLSDWQLRQIPHARTYARLTRRLASRSLQWLERRQPGKPDAGMEAISPLRLLRAAIPRLENLLRVRLPAEFVCPGVGSCVSEPRKIFFMINHEADEVRVQAADPEEMLQRTIHLARYEGLSLLKHYLAYQFAFPGRTNATVERAHETEVALLRRAMMGKETYVVYYPRPVSLQKLYEAMAPICVAQPVAAATVRDLEGEMLL